MADSPVSSPFLLLSLNRLPDPLDRRINPILLREFRCGIRSRRLVYAFWLVLGVTLLLAILIIRSRISSGQDGAAFILLSVGLTFLLVDFVPAMHVRRVAKGSNCTVSLGVQSSGRRSSGGAA